MSGAAAAAVLAVAGGALAPAPADLAPAAADLAPAAADLAPAATGAAALDPAVPTTGPTASPTATPDSGTAPATSAGPSSSAAPLRTSASGTVTGETSTSQSSAPAGSTSGSPGESGSAAVISRPVPPARSPDVIPGASPSAPFVSFIGDSWTDGTGATDKVGYAHLTGRALGWAHRVLGVGGSGYVRGGSGNVPFGERVAPAVAGGPDVVVVQGSINERSTPGPELTAAATDVLTRLREAAGPDTAVLVLGASYVPGVPARYVDKVNTSVRTAAARLGLPFVDVAAENWSDPADPSIWADPYHVNDRGAQLVADRLAPLLRAVVAG